MNVLLQLSHILELPVFPRQVLISTFSFILGGMTFEPLSFLHLVLWAAVHLAFSPAHHINFMPLMREISSHLAQATELERIESIAGLSSLLSSFLFFATFVAVLKWTMARHHFWVFPWNPCLKESCLPLNPDSPLYQFVPNLLSTMSKMFLPHTWTRLEVMGFADGFHLSQRLSIWTV